MKITLDGQPMDYKNKDPMYTFGTYMYSTDYVGEHIHLMTLTAGKDGPEFVALSKADNTPKYAIIIKQDILFTRDPVHSP